MGARHGARRADRADGSFFRQQQRPVPGGDGCQLVHLLPRRQGRGFDELGWQRNLQRNRFRPLFHAIGRGVLRVRGRFSGRDLSQLLGRTWFLPAVRRSTATAAEPTPTRPRGAMAAAEPASTSRAHPSRTRLRASSAASAALPICRSTPAAARLSRSTTRLATAVGLKSTAPASHRPRWPESSTTPDNSKPAAMPRIL